MRLIDEDSLIERVRCNADIAKQMCMPNVYNGISIACGEIDHAPTIDAEPVRHGRWEYGESFMLGSYRRCSACGGMFPCNSAWVMSYCPDCGSKMDEVSE